MMRVERVRAQGDPNTERFVPSLDPEGFFTVQGTRTPGSLLWNLGLFFSYAYDPVVVISSEDESLALVEQRVTTDLSVQAGLGGRVALAFLAPFALIQSGESLGRYREPDPAAFAVGDPTVALRYRFFGDDADEEKEHHDGPGVAIQAAAALPVGTDDALFSSGGVKLQLLGDFHLLGAGLGLSLGWIGYFESQDYPLVESDRDKDKQEIAFGLGFKLPLPWFPEIIGVLEVHGATSAAAPFSQWKTTPLEGELGARFNVGDFCFNAAIGAGLSDAYGAPDFRGILGVWWSPRTSDSDGDGIEDDADQCPHLAEDLDSFQDADGCPDPDNDGDWVLDLDDRCPFEAADENRDLDEDGCTDKR